VFSFVAPQKQAKPELTMHQLKWLEELVFPRNDAKSEAF